MFEFLRHWGIRPPRERLLERLRTADDVFQDPATPICLDEALCLQRTDRPLLWLASVGSGTTFVLSTGVMFLTAVLDGMPLQVLLIPLLTALFLFALLFLSNHAVADLQLRTGLLLGMRTTDPAACTTCGYDLCGGGGDRCSECGYPKRFALYADLKSPPADERERRRRGHALRQARVRLVPIREGEVMLGAFHTVALAAGMGGAGAVLYTASSFGDGFTWPFLTVAGLCVLAGVAWPVLAGERAARRTMRDPARLCWACGRIDAGRRCRRCGVAEAVEGPAG